MRVTYVLASLAGLSAAVSAATIFDWKNAADSKGNKIPDFSFTGYHAQDKPLPLTGQTPTIALTANSGDQTSKITKALQSLAPNGGVLLLRAGNWTVKPGFQIPNNTIVRGEGTGKTTLLVSSGATTLFSAGPSGLKVKTGAGSNITDSYVPVGTTQFHVLDTSNFAIGQDVFVQREVTEQWVEDMKMTEKDLGAGNLWIKPGDTIQQPRKIVAKDDSARVLIIDVPLTDQLDSKYSTPQVTTYSWPDGASSEIGIEDMSIILNPTCSGRKINDTTCEATVVDFRPYTQDSWARNLEVTGYNNAFHAEKGSRRITFDNISHTRNGDSEKGGYASDFATDGCQILVYNCSVLATTPKAKSYTVTTGSKVPGPNAVVNFWTQYPPSSIEPHQRWAHGFLVDSSAGSLQYWNRGDAGSGHGWTVNSAVSWNNKAAKAGFIRVDSPPVGTNWAIGNTGGKRTGDSKNIYSNGSAVLPASLFAAQKAARGLSN